MSRVIHIHPQAPAQPAPGQPCNGCGVCCLAEPCPVGMLVSRRRHGACAALRWDEGGRRYVCGALAGAAAWRLPLLGAWAGRLAGRLMTRWIAAGIGCDASLVAEPGGRGPHSG